VRPRALVALLLVLVVAGLTPLAKASPPDPTWVAGLWDNGDYDDVVLTLEQEGVQKFSDSFKELLDGVMAKRGALVAS